MPLVNVSFQELHEASCHDQQGAPIPRVTATLPPRWPDRRNGQSVRAYRVQREYYPGNQQQEHCCCHIISASRRVETLCLPLSLRFCLVLYCCSWFLLRVIPGVVLPFPARAFDFRGSRTMSMLDVLVPSIRRDFFHRNLLSVSGLTEAPRRTRRSHPHI